MCLFLFIDILLLISSMLANCETSVIRIFFLPNKNVLS